MSTSLLATFVIVLSEIVIILLALAAYLILRLRKFRSAVKMSQSRLPEEKPTASEPSLPGYIEDQITRTTKKLEEIGEMDDTRKKSALAGRLGLLNIEKQVLDVMRMDAGKNDVWDTVEQLYEGDAASLDTKGNNIDKNAIFLSRLRQLEIFKDLFFNAQNKLKDSFDVINNLKNTISNMHTNEENSQIEDMVDKLSVDNISLHKQLDKANQQLKSILDDATKSAGDGIEIIPSEADKNTNGQSDEVNQLKDENDFLATQIQSLLQQELAQTKALQERINELEASQLENLASIEKFNDLKEENEFLTTQIQFLLQQELGASKIHQERIRELETTLKQEQQKPDGSKEQPSDADEMTNETHKTSTADKDNEHAITDIPEDMVDNHNALTDK